MRDDRRAYYNEIDPNAAAWLRELVRRGLIAPGDVDERSITDVEPDELARYTQCHFFAGIGGWSLALRLAGWPDDRPVWTGSCPCQPFSDAGKGLGERDPRHLWPAFRRLIRFGRPTALFGEQVASKKGRSWLARIRADLEDMGYGVGAADLCAPSACSPPVPASFLWQDETTGDAHWSPVEYVTLGPPHIRQRLFWMAHAELQRARPGVEGVEGRQGIGRDRPAINGTCDHRMGDAIGARLEGHARHGDDRDEPGRLDADAAGSTPEAGGAGGRMADAERGTAERHRHEVGRTSGEDQVGAEERQRLRDDARHGCDVGWSDFDLVACRDGKARRVESGTFPLAARVPARVVRLRGYGNAIVPQVAADFIVASIEAIEDLTTGERPNAATPQKGPS